MPEFMVPKLNVVNTAGGEISYREAGSGDPLILLHGINIHSGIWGYQFYKFASSYRVIAWDAPSYGKSKPREGKVDVYAVALAELLDVLNIEIVRIIGHSMGGIVSGAFIQKFSDRVHAVVLSSTHTGAALPEKEPLAERYQTRIKERAELEPIEYGRMQAEKMTTNEASCELKEKIASVVAETSAAHFPINAAMCQQADNSSALSTFKSAALILHGGADRLSPLEGHKRLLAAMPEAEKYVFTNLGHSPYLEDPLAYNSVVESFFERN